jgi:hypothetical protein
MNMQGLGVNEDLVFSIDRTGDLRALDVNDDSFMFCSQVMTIDPIGRPSDVSFI